MPDLAAYSRRRTLSSPSSSPSLTGTVVYGSVDGNEPPSPLILPTSSVLAKSPLRDKTSEVKEPSLVSTFFLSVLFLCAGVADVTINRYLLFVKYFYLQITEL